MTYSSDIEEMRKNLNPVNKIKFDMKVLELLDDEDKLTADTLTEFSKEYQIRTADMSLSYEDLAFFGAFFEKYGDKYGILEELHENGIC